MSSCPCWAYTRVCNGTEGNAIIRLRVHRRPLKPKPLCARLSSHVHKFAMTSENTPLKSESERAIVTFRDACIRFRELTRPTESRRGSFYGGSLYGSAKDQLKFVFRHPLQAYADFFKIAVTYPSNLNALDIRFPIDEMLLYLEQYSVEELQGLKTLTALNFRTHKDRLTDNPIFKISIPLGALYGLIKVGSEWGPQSKFSATVAEYLKIALDTEFVSALFLGVLAGLSIVVIQIMFLIGPGIARAQLLDDLVSIALEAKRSSER
jgi:hypothetical protein